MMMMAAAAAAAAKKENDTGLRGQRIRWSAYPDQLTADLFALAELLTVSALSTLRCRIRDSCLLYLPLAGTGTGVPITFQIGSG